MRLKHRRVNYISGLLIFVQQRSLRRRDCGQSSGWIDVQVPPFRWL